MMQLIVVIQSLILLILTVRIYNIKKRVAILEVTFRTLLVDVLPVSKKD